MKCALFRLGSLCCAWLAIACQPTPDPAPAPLAVAVRFVDPEARADASSQPASLLTAPPRQLFDRSQPLGPLAETIGDETRWVLAAPRRETLVPMTSIDVTADGRAATVARFGPGMRDAGRIALIPSVRASDGWSHLDPQLVALPESGDTLEIELKIPPDPLQGRSAVPVVVRAIAAESSRASEYRTGSVVVPQAASLDFAYGLLHASAGQSPVRFSVSICDADVCEPLFEQTLVPDAAANRWHERRVALGPHAGSARSFRFATERSGADPSDYALPVWADPKILAPRAPTGGAPNLLLISIDTLRADHLGLYGYGRDTSPHLDRLATQRAAVFDAFTAASTHTGPSHMTLFTSLPPSLHGVRGNLTRLSAPVATLPELLRDRGYATAAFTGGGPLNPDIGFGRGFDLYGVDPGAANELGSQVERMRERAQHWLSEDRARPFFLFLHTFEVHTPYDPQERYRSLFHDDAFARREAVANPGAQPAAAQRDDYDREIRHVDDTLGAFFEWFDAEGFGDDTIVVILSDHGEEFLDHGGMGHATLPFQSVLHVPLIVFGPGIAARRITPPVAHDGLMPTLLELLQIPAPATLRGLSFANALRGTADASSGQSLVSEAWNLPEGFEPPSLAIRSGNWKLIRARSNAGELSAIFDLAADPGELRPAAPDSPQAERLSTDLTAYDAQIEQLEKALHTGAADDASLLAPSPEAEQRLRELGYIE